MGEKFEMPVPTFLTEKDPIFDELEKTHLAWVKGAVSKAPEDMVIAIVMRAAAAGAIINELSKEDFLVLATKTYEHMLKMQGARRG
jgi:hypothetical protein